MSRYLRGRLNHIRESVQPPKSPRDNEARAHAVAHLEHIAQARREGTWTAEDAARAREAVRSARVRRGEG